MAHYVSLAGVRTWYDEHGDGDPLVLLHPGGGGVDSRAFGPNVGPLAARFHLYTPERRGHGRTADVAGPITFDAMARDTVASWKPSLASERTWSGPATVRSSRCS